MSESRITNNPKPQWADDLTLLEASDGYERVSGAGVELGVDAVRTVVWLDEHILTVGGEIAQRFGSSTSREENEARSAVSRDRRRRHQLRADRSGALGDGATLCQGG